MRLRGLEPPWDTPHGPEPCASAKFRHNRVLYYYSTPSHKHGIAGLLSGILVSCLGQSGATAARPGSDFTASSRDTRWSTA